MRGDFPGSLRNGGAANTERDEPVTTSEIVWHVVPKVVLLSVPYLALVAFLERRFFGRQDDRPSDDPIHANRKF
jgi:hypothetical protein